MAKRISDLPPVVGAAQPTDVIPIDTGSPPVTKKISAGQMFAAAFGIASFPLPPNRVLKSDAAGNFSFSTSISEDASGNVAIRKATVDASTLNTAGTDTGAVNAYAVTIPQTSVTLVKGLRLQFTPANSNTGASTLAVNGLTAKNVVGPGGATLAPGQLSTSNIADVIYDGTAFELQSVVPINPQTTVVNIAGLRLLSKLLYTTAQVAGYYAIGDGGGGFYYYVSTDTTSADNGGTIIVASDGGRWYLRLQGPISVKQFGCRGDNSTNDAAAFSACINWALSSSGVPDVYIPSGRYILNSTQTFTGIRGLKIAGASSAILSTGVGYAQNTTLIFDGAGAGANGLVFNDFFGLKIKDLMIQMRRGGAGGGKALFLYNGADYTIDGVRVDLLVGTTGSGIRLGDGSFSTTTFDGLISNCKVLGFTGTSFDIQVGTSLTFTACYQIGGRWRVVNLAYSSFVSCASDDTATGYYGFELSQCQGIGFYSTGTETADKGGWLLSGGSTAITFISPVGVGNNLSDGTGYGDLITIDNTGGACTAIYVINPTVLSQRAASTANIYGTSGTGITEVTGVVGSTFSKGIAGDATWRASKLTLVGSGDQISWTPTLVGWVNSGTPTVTGSYVKQGDMVTFTVTITPATNISATLGAATITGLPFNVLAGMGGQTTGAGASQGIAAVSAAGTIFPQTTGVLTTSVTITGSLIIQ